MKAVILAAGRGSRLNPVTEHIHKCLLEIDGTPILEQQIHALSEAGVEELYVVTGYRHEDIENNLNKFGRNSINIHTVNNDDWMNSENSRSLLLTEQHVKGDEFVILNCDIWMETNYICELIEEFESNIAPYDSLETDEDALQIKLDGANKPQSILPKGHPKGDGATLGLFILSSEGSELLFNDINKYIDDDEVKAYWFEHSVSRIFNTIEFSAVDVKDQIWFEIDTKKDLLNANEYFGVSESQIQNYLENIKP